MKQKFALAVAIIFCLIGIFTYVPQAEAGGLTQLEFGLEIDSDFTDFKGTTSLNDGRAYTFGELDFELFIIDWRAGTEWKNYKRSKDIAGGAGIYARLYTLKGGALEFLAGIDQPATVDDGKFGLSNVRTWSLRARHPLGKRL